MELDGTVLIELAHYKMPFGKYKNQYLIDVPEHYYIWYQQKGFPEGKLGRMMAQMCEIKINGLEELIYTIRRDFKKQS